jgi:hypothetical protein
MDELEQGNDDAPRFMVLYCSIMILLLAFFIILQSLSSSQEGAHFHAGRGSFVRALNSFGLGRLFATYGLSARGGVSARYDVDGETNGLGRLARDPEIEAARGALKRLKREVATSETGRGKWAATVLAPHGDESGGESLDGQQKAFFRLFARRALPELLTDRSVIGIGAVYTPGRESEGKEALRALELAREAHAEILDAVPVRLSSGARRNLYSFCRADGSDSAMDGIRLHVEVSDLKQDEQIGQ